jgi:hypothetical protein
MAAQQPRGLRLSYARLHSARATVGITPRPGALPVQRSRWMPFAWQKALRLKIQRVCTVERPRRSCPIHSFAVPFFGDNLARDRRGCLKNRKRERGSPLLKADKPTNFLKTAPVPAGDHRCLNRSARNSTKTRILGERLRLLAKITAISACFCEYSGNNLISAPDAIWSATI